MADYDGVYAAIPDNTQVINISATAFYPDNNFYVPATTNNYHVDIDTATIVSIASSCIILISGCIAVVCLIMYMKKTDMLYRSRTCAKCGAHVTRDDSTNPRVPNITDNNPDLTHQTPILTYQQTTGQNTSKKELDSIVILRGLSVTNNPTPNKTNMPKATHFTADIESEQINKSLPLISNPPPEFGDSTFKNESEEDPFGDNEPTPYATFNLPGFDTNTKISDTYETFVAKFTEPPYMLLKKGLECPAPPQYADSVDYKMRNKLTEENIYQAAGLSQCHSIASCSSNHEELIRAYEYGKQQKQKLIKLQNEFIECLNENDTDDPFYRSLASDRESPTDPGIREFTKSPPRPNEQRQGIVLHHQPTHEELTAISKHIMVSNMKEDDFDIKPSSNKNEASSKNEMSPNETSNSFSSIQESSSAATSSNDSTPSAGSESANHEESSSSTATPEHYPDIMEERNRANFGAIPRDRSRNPSWASFTTMKSNTVLNTQYPGSETQSDRAFTTNKTNEPILEGLSSDDEDFKKPQPVAQCIALGQNTLEDIYSPRMAHYGFSNTQFAGATEQTNLFGPRTSNRNIALRNSATTSQDNFCSEIGNRYPQSSERVQDNKTDPLYERQC